jgi:hypothetical protein
MVRLLAEALAELSAAEQSPPRPPAPPPPPETSAPHACFIRPDATLCCRAHEAEFEANARALADRPFAVIPLAQWLR